MICAILLVRWVWGQFCKVDEDCWVKPRPDTHSLYCIESKCQKILPPGFRCENPSECASFFYFGPLACSAKCRIENECEHFDIRNLNSKYCCRSVPEKGECMPDRPSMLSGCDPRQSCIMDGKDGFRCTSLGMSSWVYGAFMSILGNLCINIGINLQKKSYKKSSFRVLGILVYNFTLGILMYTLGKVLSFSAYIFGNQSLLASLSAFGLVANSIFAPLINNEVFTWKDFMAILLVLTGSSVIMMHAGRSERAFSLCELLKMYKKTETLVWFLFLGLLILGMYLLIKYVEVNSDWGLPDDFFAFLNRENVFFEEGGVVLKYLMLVMYVSLSALIAAFTSLFAKSFGEMVEKTISGDNQLFFGVTYMFFVLLVGFTFWQIYWLNRALKHYDVLLSLPVFHAIWTVLSIFNAGIYFSDFEYFTKTQVSGFILGLIIIFMGSVFLGSRVYDRDKIRVVPMELDITAVKRD